MANGAGGSTSYERYEVVGDDLSAVRDDIFDLANGKGTLSADGQTRFGGFTEFRYTYRSALRFDPNAKQVTIQITEIAWTTKIRLPNWRREQLQAAPAAQRKEYLRALAGAHKHELGHVYLYNFGMERVRAALVGKAAGRTIIAAAKEPQFNANGSPKTPQDKTIADAIEAATRKLVTEQADFVEMERKQQRYDGPPGPNADPDSVFTISDPADQPDGTDHGRTQGADLRIP